MKNSALIIKVPAGSSFEETVKVIQESGVNPDDFGATVTGMRKTKGGDIVVDLGKSRKSREAAAPLKKALTEKLAGTIVTVAASGTLVDMEVIDLEPTSTAEGVLAALKSAFLASSKGDPQIESAVNDIKVTSMWRLKNGQQVAKVSVPRWAKPTEVSRVRVGWTSCRLRIRHPEATRCFKCHGFGHSQGSLSLIHI